MKLFARKPSFLKVLRESLMVLIAAVLIWRGIWVLLDKFDEHYMHGSHVWSALAGIIVGCAMVFFADRDLEDLV
ncbi:MAG: hypothetical protein NTX72_03000 [Candidatus Uhrbacteria bacterium]|nr:hypothetical protein [Candidatus Uhrbacteria bacterium]